MTCEYIVRVPFGVLLLSFGHTSQAAKVCPEIPPPYSGLFSTWHNKFFEASAVALVFYDYALTFEDEVSCMV